MSFTNNLRSFSDVYGEDLHYLKWWTADTIKGVSIPLGEKVSNLADKTYPMLCESTPNALIYGEPGSGLINTIQQAILAMTRMYSPEELKIIALDFSKSQDFIEFTERADYLTKEWLTEAEAADISEIGATVSNQCIFPQVSLLSGDTGLEGMMSTLHYVHDYALDVQSKLNKLGASNLEFLRSEMLNDYNSKSSLHADTTGIVNKQLVLPRTVVVIHRIDRLFKNLSVKQIDHVKSELFSIFMLGRAVGVHFIFTAESLPDFEYEDLLSYIQLRLVLPCTPAASSALIGHVVDIKHDHIFCNVTNATWKLPRVEHTDLVDFFTRLDDLAETFDIKCSFANYIDPNATFSYHILDALYNKSADYVANPSIFILGEKALPSDDMWPLCFSMYNTDDADDHILVAASERRDMVNLVMTLIHNLKRSTGDVDYVTYCTDYKTRTLIPDEDICTKSMQHLCHPAHGIRQLIYSIDSIIGERELNPNIDTPVYVILLGCEYIIGLSSDHDNILLRDFADVLEDGPRVNVHFIFACMERRSLPRYISNSCAIKICGALDKDDTWFFADSKLPFKLPASYMSPGRTAYIEYGDSINKFCIYNFLD